MLLALSSVLASHEVVENFRFSGIRFHNCRFCLVCALDNIINLQHGTHGDHVGPFIDVDLLSHRFRPSRTVTLWQLVRYICVYFVDKPWGKRKRRTIAHVEGKVILILTYRFGTC